jgi:hypothetical protein
MASIDYPDAGLNAIDKMAKPAHNQGRFHRGFNPLLSGDYHLFLTLPRSEWSISGFRAADIRGHLTHLSPARTSHFLKRLRTHGLIKNVAHRYIYYLTQLGRRVLSTTFRIRDSLLVPSLCSNHP